MERMSTVAGRSVVPTPAKPRYVRAVGPRLRKLLYLVFALVAILGANSVYLSSVTFLEWVSRRWGEGLAYQNHFYLSMFMAHLALGLLLHPVRNAHVPHRL